MQLEQLQEIAHKNLQLNWSEDVGYVFVEPSPFVEGEYEIIVPAVWPAQCEVNLSWKWAVHMALKGEKCFEEIVSTPLMKYSFALSRLMAEMEQLTLNVTSFVKAHEGLDQKEYANVVNNACDVCIMRKKRSIKKILFEARKRSPREAVNAFYEKYATGIFYP